VNTAGCSSDCHHDQADRQNFHGFHFLFVFWSTRGSGFTFIVFYYSCGLRFHRDLHHLKICVPSID
jgi:hypothetical protein